VVVKAIRSAIDRYDGIIDDFKNYREIILNEKVEFEKQVRALLESMECR
jgi:hypothetical protein